MSVPLADERDWIITAIHVLENKHAAQLVLVTAILHISLLSLSLLNSLKEKNVSFLTSKLKKVSIHDILQSPVQSYGWLVLSSLLFSSTF
jgi:hypothetical protein